jgi:ribosomal protein L37AE/L43A
LKKTKTWISDCPHCNRELTFISTDYETWKCLFCKYELIAPDDWTKEIMMKLSNIKEEVREIIALLKVLAK